MSNFIINEEILDALDNDKQMQELGWDYPMLLDFIRQNLRYGVFFNNRTHPVLNAKDAEITVYFSHALLDVVEQQRRHHYPVVPVMIHSDIIGRYDTEYDRESTEEVAVTLSSVQQNYYVVLMLPDIDTVIKNVPFYGSEREHDDVIDKYEMMWNRLYESYDRYTYQMGGYAHFIQDGDNNTFLMDYRSGYGDNGSFYLHYNQTPSLDLQMF